MSDQDAGHDAEDELARSDREWAAQAQATQAAQALSGATSAPGGVGGAGAGSVPGSDDRRTGPRPVRGPSGNGLGWLRGLGLLSVLAVIAIMALFSWRILSDTGGGDVQIVRGDPGSSAPATSAPTGDAQLGGGSTDSAAEATCEIDRQTVEVAAQAYEIEHGARPADLQALVDAGYLVPNLELEVEIAADGTVVSTGTCAGG